MGIDLAVKLHSNQRVTSDWHTLNCVEIGKEKPICKCAEPKHHVGAFEVAKFIGLVPLRRNGN